MGDGDYGWTGQEPAARKQALLSAILPIEWQMFSRVNEGVAPQAWCQQMPKTFAIMRSAQALSWTPEVMESYLGDLQDAVALGRNLMTEKYARMMRLQGRIPDDASALVAPPSAEVEAIIQRIVEVSAQWRTESTEKYPKLISRGRVQSAADEGEDNVSFETYLQGELETYSPRTLELYLKMVELALSEGVNLEEECLKNTVSAYGFHSLEEAERNLREA